MPSQFYIAIIEMLDWSDHLQISDLVIWFFPSYCQLESIEELERFIVKHRKDYVDLHRTTEQERDSIEHEVSSFPILMIALHDLLSWCSAPCMATT